MVGRAEGSKGKGRRVRKGGGDVTESVNWGKSAQHAGSLSKTDRPIKCGYSYTNPNIGNVAMCLCTEGW